MMGMGRGYGQQYGYGISYGNDPAIDPRLFNQHQQSSFSNAGPTYTSAHLRNLHGQQASHYPAAGNGNGFSNPCANDYAEVPLRPRSRPANKSYREPEERGEKRTPRCRRKVQRVHVSSDEDSEGGDKEMNTDKNTTQKPAATSAHGDKFNTPTPSTVRDDDVLFLSENGEEAEEDAVLQISEARKLKEDALAAAKARKGRPAPPAGKTGFEPTQTKLKAALKATKKQIKQEAGKSEESGESEEDCSDSDTSEKKSKPRKGGYGKGTARRETHLPPPLIDANSRSTAYKLKRGVSGNGRSKRISVHGGRAGKGLNDPDNLLIVKLKEVEKMNFKQIAKIINDGRVSRGQLPSYTSNNINCRYNRTAPQLYQAKNKKFRRLADRVNGAKSQVWAHRVTEEEEELAGWTDVLDIDMVRFHNNYEESKWKTVAKQMREKMNDEDHPDWPSAVECAQRYMHI